MFVTATVTMLPLAVEVLITVTSLDAFNFPVPIDVSLTFKVTFPAVLEKPPNFAETLDTDTPEGRVVVKVMLVAGLDDEPT